jgi:hypothetical protein
VRHLPRQSLVVVPPVAALKVPLVPQWEIDERTMKQVGEVLDGPIEEDNHHLLVFSYTLSNAGNIGPQPVARLSWGVTDYYHIAKVIQLLCFFIFSLCFFYSLCTFSFIRPAERFSLCCWYGIEKNTNW